MSASLHTEALCWLRFGKRLPVVCTEAGPWRADVLGVSDKMAVEVEIKKSKSDLQAEFRNKKAKHVAYANAEGVSTGFVPNYLYFYVPEHMGEHTVKVIEEFCPKAGVAVHTDTNHLDGRNTIIIRKPTRLRAKPPGSGFVRIAIQRMSSELCGRHLALDGIQSQILGKLQMVSAAALEAAIRISGALDAEDRAADLLKRAEELAFAVDGIQDFSALEPAQRERWMTAATRWLEAQYLNSKGWENGVRL